MWETTCLPTPRSWWASRQHYLVPFPCCMHGPNARGVLICLLVGACLTLRLQVDEVPRSPAEDICEGKITHPPNILAAPGVQIAATVIVEHLSIEFCICLGGSACL